MASADAAAAILVVGGDGVASLDACLSGGAGGVAG